MTAILRVEDAEVHFGGVRAIDGVSLELERGELHGMVGPNGSGKTTLLNAISRVGPLTSGAITFEGADTRRVPAHRLNLLGLARTFQAIRLIPTLTVRENVMVGADRHQASSTNWAKPWTTRAAAKRSEEIADEVMARLRLSSVADHFPTSLPYGTQRRVEIARALAGQPSLLLLDEPVAGMNREERSEIAHLIKDIRDTGLTQLVIEHDVGLLLRLCDRLSVMHFGKCIATGEPKATAALPAVREAYLGKGYGVT